MAPKNSTVGPKRNSKTSPQPKTANVELARMRVLILTAFLFLTPTSMIVGVVVFFLSKNIEAAAVFQLPVFLCLYKVISFLFPTSENQSPFLEFIHLFLKRK
ncbi:hypothetical protein [Ktedonobacter racemifer]|uniref:Uncharacterized protein n=1 Tax=Ktedonobacter racemifer DSM 44963 TaxID=485913 RepID=D6U8S2_KTERA|nr:hypothetical protein [Ktedonobacter racemifer]EFH79632.1 hypothetical protein Krac_0110 [Ktedonobacter racemifer DSM 44963]